MNAVEIEAAISELAIQPFDAAEFPFAFLAAFGNKDMCCAAGRATPHQMTGLIMLHITCGCEIHKH